VEAQILFLTSALDGGVTKTTPRSIWPWERTSVPLNCDLVGHYAASGGNSLPTFRHILRVPSSSVKNLEDGMIGCPETSVRNNHYSLRNISEERSSHLLRGGGLRSRNSGTHFIGSCVGPKACVKDLEMRNNSCTCRDSKNPYRPARSLSCIKVKVF